MHPKMEVRKVLCKKDAGNDWAIHASRLPILQEGILMGTRAFDSKVLHKRQ